jgi:hypothetical protein
MKNHLLCSLYFYNHKLDKLKAVDFPASNQQTRSCLAFSLYLSKLEVARLFPPHLYKPEVVCLFPFPYRKATNTESSFVFVAFSYPSPSKMQRKSMLSSFLLLFLTRLPQKCNEK